MRLFVWAMVGSESSEVKQVSTATPRNSLPYWEILTASHCSEFDESCPEPYLNSTARLCSYGDGYLMCGIEEVQSRKLASRWDRYRDQFTSSLSSLRLSLFFIAMELIHDVFDGAGCCTTRSPSNPLRRYLVSFGCYNGRFSDVLQNRTAGRGMSCLIQKNHQFAFVLRRYIILSLYKPTYLRSTPKFVISLYSAGANFLIHVLVHRY